MASRRWLVPLNVRTPRRVLFPPFILATTQELKNNLRTLPVHVYWASTSGQLTKNIQNSTAN